MTEGAQRRRIGIALGGGAARGWAHIGVLEALAEAGFAPDLVAGTSMGALVGGAWAAGRLDDLKVWARQADRRRIMGLIDVNLPLRAGHNVLEIAIRCPPVNGDQSAQVLRITSVGLHRGGMLF